MRINAHAHIFNLKAVFTPETLHILMNRLKLEGMPKFMLDGLYERIESFLRNKVDGKSIVSSLEKSGQAAGDLADVIGKLKAGGHGLDLLIGGQVANLSGNVSDFLRDKLMELVDLDENGEIKQNWFDYLEFLRIAMLPSIAKVTDEVMGQMGDDDALVALAMDITDGTDDGKLYAKQLKAMSNAVQAYPGRLFPFVMVNPIRKDYAQTMRNAIEKKGFWGVKLYLSLGYDVFSDEMAVVYEYCQKKDIPILSHCTDEGFRRDLPSGQLASPDKWMDVFKDFPRLKVCFGHFGADNALIRDNIDPKSWTGMILQLMKQHPNVYADISYHTDAMIGADKIDKKTARKNYERNIKDLLKQQPFKKRLLFGTDFWLVRAVTKDSDYWSFYKKMFTEAQFKSLTQTNPENYLGLPGAEQPSAELIECHLSFFKSKQFKVRRKPAKWLSDALAASGSAAGGFVVGG
jgi:predicted TIM-barrel fold metal-dependent hydrolase